MNVTKEQIENFLMMEADLLDQWELEQWADLFTEDSLYLIPSTDVLDGDHRKDLFFVSDDHFRIQQRAKRLLKKEAHAEYPRSRTLHMISNVRINEIKDETIYVTCKFAVYRTKFEVLDHYLGHHEYKIVQRDGVLKILEKRVHLLFDSLRPQGKISIVL